MRHKVFWCAFSSWWSQCLSVRLMCEFLCLCCSGVIGGFWLAERFYFALFLTNLLSRKCHVTHCICHTFMNTKIRKKNINGKQFYYNVIHYEYFYVACNTMYFFKICPYFYMAVNGKICYTWRFIYTEKYQLFLV